MTTPNGEKVAAWSAIYQTESAAATALSTQTLVLFGAVIAYGTAVSAVIAAGVEITDPWVLALPLPAWMALGYQALLTFQIGEHSEYAKEYRKNLASVGTAIAVTITKRGPVGSFAMWGNRLIFYGIASVLVIFGTVYCILWGDPACVYRTIACIAYGVFGIVLSVAWGWLFVMYFKAP